MTDTKHISGLRLLNATRLALTNHDTSVPTIAVNGRKLSHADIDFGTLLIANGTVKTKDAVDEQYYEVLNSNSKIDVRFEEEVQAGKVQAGQIIPAGDQLFKQQSPAPFAYIDTTGRLGSANLWNQLFVANIWAMWMLTRGWTRTATACVRRALPCTEGCSCGRTGSGDSPLSTRAR